MQKYTLPIAFVVIGLVAGWGLASIVANQKDEAIKAAFPSGYRDFYTQYDGVLKDMTREDIERLVDNIVQYEDNELREVEIFQLGRISFLPSLQDKLQNNNIAGIKEMATAQVQEFLESHAKGSYQSSNLSDDWKNLADSMAEKLRQEEQQKAGD